MHIEKIELKNFKSFSRKTEIPFVKGFNVISGPNGSGKSNIIDAILFCLGLSSSTKVLRAEKLTDLISLNSNGKEAEVSIILNSEDIGEKNKIEVKRRIKVTESGYYSYYYINSKPCSLTDVKKLLEKAGIYEDTPNVIMQGDVTRIVEMSPYQRRKIIDDIAGISEFDEKKEKALQELEVVRENIEKISAVLAEVDQQLKTLEKDREEALRYKSLLERKEELEREILAHKRQEVLRKLERVTKEIIEGEREIDKLHEEFTKLKAEIEKLNEEFEEIVREISSRMDERYKELQRRISEARAEIEKISEENEFYSSQIQELESKKIKVLSEISKLRDEIDEVLKELEKLSLQRMSVEEEKEELESKINLLKIKISQADEKYGKLRDEFLRKREEVEELKTKLNEVIRERDVILESLRKLDMFSAELSAEKEAAEKEIEALKRDVEKEEKELEILKKQLSSELKSRNEIDKRIFSIRRELADLEEKIKEKEIELTKIRTEISSREAFFGKAVELILEAKEKRALPGVYGTVSQLGEVDQEFALALEVAAGNALSFIVVENEEDAVRAINYLKEIKGGRATFLPLNKIRKNFGKIELDKKVLKEKGVIDYAVNLIRCEDKFRPIFNFVYRDTLVVDNLENAKRLMDGRRIVTLDGDLIEKSGAMTGGSPEKLKSGILMVKELLKREKEVLEEITVLNSKKSILNGELRKAEGAWRDAQKKIEELEEKVKEIQNAISSKKGKFEGMLSRISEIERRLKEKEEEKEELKIKLSEKNEEIKRLEEEIAKISSEMEKIERQLRGSEIPKLTEELEKLKSEYDVRTETLRRIETQVEKLTFVLSQKNNSIKEREEEIKEIERRVEDIRKKIKEKEERRVELEKLLKSYEEEVFKLEEEAKDLRAKRDEIFEKMRRKEAQKKEIEYRIVALTEKLKARREVEEKLKAELTTYPEIQPKMRKEEAIDQLEKVEKELADFGEVNMKAIQEYEEVKKRRDDLFERKLTLEREREEILERIEKYEKMKRETFFETFDRINEYFKEIIAELTEGWGELYLDNPEDPFNSGLHMRVKPRNKPIQKLESMSGGEKSLVALAFILAIQRYKPAPFYAFDEVDMFLDGVNVKRVAKMIKRMSKNAQFIVVSLRKPMIEEADAIIGVTLGRDNSSVVTGIKLSKTQ